MASLTNFVPFKSTAGGIKRELPRVIGESVDGVTMSTLSDNDEKSLFSVHDVSQRAYAWNRSCRKPANLYYHAPVRYLFWLFSKYIEYSVRSKTICIEGAAFSGS